MLLRVLKIAAAALLAVAAWLLLRSGADRLLIGWALACLVSFALTLLLLMRPFLRLLNSVHWKTAAGVLLQRDPQPQKKARGRLEYEYYVGGRRYRGANLSFGPGAGRQTGAEPGGQVTIWYDPANPADAVLQRRVELSWPLWLIGAVCVFTVYVFWRLNLLP